MSDIFEHPHPAVAVDLAILCVQDGAVHCAVMRREDGEEMGGDWALPGGFVHRDCSFDDTVARVLADKTGLQDVHFEQLASYGAPDRDPRGHVISVVYMAITTAESLGKGIAQNPALTLARVEVDWSGETGGPARAMAADGTPLTLAFDHADILGDMIKRLRGKLDYTPIGFSFLPPRFTLLEVQEVHEAILNHPLTKPAFRRKLLDRHALRPTGARQTGGAFRPAELYEIDPKGGQ
ncbi:NUDIX hydrolase [Roseovarius sp. 2305UL8-3]|uniref:NUDIX hydrolase n=1 Tax=Roseovarius conchicola TaxID=3121636 RepID=UPI003527D219